MTVLDHFKALCALPHCSARAEAMRGYLRERAEAYGYTLTEDAAGNLLCAHPDASVTLQAHYDMVCIGAAPVLELVEEEGWLRAEGSTLGADNGMGMAMMLALMEEGAPVDALFTADEEIGLIGARALALPLKTPFLLNLDSEAFGEITIGCAGGVDLEVTLPLAFDAAEGYGYEVVAEGYPGGHSGVDIDKGIPNAIKELAARLHALPGSRLVRFDGGERRNAIAKRASAVIVSQTPLHDEKLLPLGRGPYRAAEGDIVRMLHGFAHGVRGWNGRLGVVQSSINLAEVTTEEDLLHITLSARAMGERDLRRLAEETQVYFEAFGATVKQEGYYAPWEPEEEAFVTHVRAVYEAVAERPVQSVALHAGLECGIIKKQFPSMQMASIGPTIVAPHSTRERVDLESVEQVFEVVKRIIMR